MRECNRKYFKICVSYKEEVGKERGDKVQVKIQVNNDKIVIRVTRKQQETRKKMGEEEEKMNK